MPILEQVGVQAVVAGAAQYVSDSTRVNQSTTKMTEGVTRAARDAGAAEKSLAQVGSRMREVGSQGIFLGAALTAPAAAALVLAVNFETAMTRISTLSGIATEDIGELRDGLFEISQISAQGPDELARGLLTITSTGKQGAEALAILEASAKASAIGLGETNEVARTITAAVTAFASQGLTAAHAADVLFATVREGGAEVGEVAGSLGRVVGIAAQVGVSFEDVGAFIATFTRLGVGADEAVTALRGTLTTLINPSEQATEALSKAGLSMEQLRQTAREKGLNEALRLIIEAFRGNEEALSDVIPNVRALAGILGTAGSQAEEFGAVLNALRDSEGDLDEAFETTSRTSAFKFQQAIADIKREVIEAGAVLLPVLSQILDVLGKVIDVMGMVPAPVLAAGIAIAGLAGIAITAVSTFGVLFGTVLALSGAAGLGGVSAAAAGAGAGLAGAGAAASGAAGGFGALGAAAGSATAAIAGVAVAAAPVIALGALVAGGIFAVAFMADKLAAEDAANAISELNRVKELSERAKTKPEEPAPPPRGGAPIAKPFVAVARAFVLGESEEQRVVRLVEQRKKLEEDIARIKKGETVEGPRGIKRSQRGLETELEDVNNQIGNRKPLTNLGVATEELASLRQLRSELDQEADAFESAGKDVAAHRLEIAKLDTQIRELQTGVRAGSAAVVESATSDVTKLREEQTEQTEQLIAAEQRLSDVLGLKPPTSALTELVALQNDATATTDQLAAAQAKLNAAMGLTPPAAALVELNRLQESGTATTDRLTAAQERLGTAVAGSGNPRAIAAYRELRAVQTDASATSSELEAAQRELNLALGLTPRVQAMVDYIALLQSGTATQAQVTAAQEKLNDALGGRGSAALIELTRLQGDASATTKELADAQGELAAALGGAANETEQAMDAMAEAIHDLIELQNSGTATTDQLAQAQKRLQESLGVTPAGTALLELNRLQESGTASAEALTKAQSDLNEAVAQSGSPAAAAALAELTTLQNTAGTSAVELAEAENKLKEALGITPPVAAFVRLIELQQSGTASAFEMRQAQSQLARTLGAEGANALEKYIALAGDANASDAERAKALGGVVVALAAADKATRDSSGIIATNRKEVTDLQEAYRKFPAIFAEREAAHRAQNDAIESGISSEDELADAADRVADAEHAAADAINSVAGEASSSVAPVLDAAAAQRELADALDKVAKRKSAAEAKIAEQNRLTSLRETEAEAGARDSEGGFDVRNAAIPLKRVQEAQAEIDRLTKAVAQGDLDTAASSSQMAAAQERLAKANRALNTAAALPGSTASGQDLTEEDRKAIEEDEEGFWEGRREAAEQAVRDAESAAREAESAHKRAISEAEAAQRELERAFRESIPGRTIEAVNQARQNRLQEQAEAVAREAFGLEGDSLGDVVARQQRSSSAFQAMRDRLEQLGIEIPESMITLFDRMAETAEDEAKSKGEMVGGLLAFFIARQIGRGRAFQDLVSVPSGVQAQLGASAAAQGGPTQQVNVTIENIGPGVTTGDIAHGVAVGVRPAMSSL